MASNLSVTNAANVTALGISIDESFAEFSIVQKTSLTDGDLVASHRVYLSRESVKTALPTFLAQNSEHKIQAAYVGMRFLEKMLDYKLGGSVAQLVTAGLENWLHLRSSHSQMNFITNPELIFAVNERTTANGQVQLELSIEELEQIEAKLKPLDTKRVCLHFLHSDKNQQNLKLAQTFFSDRGYDVYIPQHQANEVSAWRLNALNASVRGTFLETKEQIEEALTSTLNKENIHFVMGNASVCGDDKNSGLNCLFAARAAILFSEPQVTECLYLGLEKFSLLKHKTQNTWQSPWGPLAMTHPECLDLSIQPTSLLEVNAFRDLDVVSKNDGYEPGPMCMGRGQKPTFLDLFGEDERLTKIIALGDRLNANGQQRFKNTLLTLAKNSNSELTTMAEIDTLISNLKEYALKKLSQEVNINSTGTIKVIGPLAPLLGPSLRRLNTRWEITSNHYADSKALAIAGAAWNKNPEGQS